MNASTYLQAPPKRKLLGLAGVVVLHALLFWAVQAGLTRTVIQKMPNVVQALLLEEKKPELATPPSPQPPPPVPSKPPPPQTPPPAYVPPAYVPPAVTPPVAAPANAIAAVVAQLRRSAPAGSPVKTDPPPTTWVEFLNRSTGKVERVPQAKLPDQFAGMYSRR